MYGMMEMKGVELNAKQKRVLLRFRDALKKAGLCIEAKDIKIWDDKSGNRFPLTKT
jgi:hypothetical protein